MWKQHDGPEATVDNMLLALRRVEGSKFIRDAINEQCLLEANQNKQFIRQDSQTSSVDTTVLRRRHTKRYKSDFRRSNSDLTARPRYLSTGSSESTTSIKYQNQYPDSLHLLPPKKEKSQYLGTTSTQKSQKHEKQNIPSTSQATNVDTTVLGRRHTKRFWGSIMVFAALTVLSLTTGFVTSLALAQKSQTTTQASALMQPPGDVSISVQVGGWGSKPSKDVKEIYRPEECLKNYVFPDLPVQLRAHVAIDIEDQGLLVCGGTSDTRKSSQGRTCYILRHGSRKWDNFHPLNVKRVNSYMKRVLNKINIIGGSSSNPLMPSLDTEEVLDLTTNDGWQLRETAESMYSKVTQVIVEFPCELRVDL